MNNIKKLFFAAVMLCGGCATVGQTAIRGLSIGSYNAQKPSIVYDTLDNWLSIGLYETLIKH